MKARERLITTFQGKKLIECRFHRLFLNTFMKCFNINRILTTFSPQDFDVAENLLPIMTTLVLMCFFTDCYGLIYSRNSENWEVTITQGMVMPTPQLRTTLVRLLMEI